MDSAKLAEIMALKDRPVKELKAKYEEVFTGEKAPTTNKVFLWRKIAYKIQECEYGGLSNDTQSRIQELIARYDPVNNKALRPELSEEATPSAKKSRSRDRRLPIPGTVITKNYKGTQIEVKVLDKGFEYKNKTYKSLTAIAKEVTGAHWNGYLFFNM